SLQSERNFVAASSQDANAQTRSAWNSAPASLAAAGSVAGDAGTRDPFVVGPLIRCSETDSAAKVGSTSGELRDQGPRYTAIITTTINAPIKTACDCRGLTNSPHDPPHLLPSPARD